VVVRIIALGDNQRDPRHRAEEHDRVMAFIADEVERLRPTAVLHGGDWTERKPTHEDRVQLFDWVRRVSRVAPLVTVEGNHEEPGFVAEFLRLDTSRMVEAFTAPAVIEVDGVLVACLPWPRREHLRAWLLRPASADETNDLANEMLRDVMRGFRVQFDAMDPMAVRPRVLLLHAEPEEYMACADQPQVARGMRVEYGDMVHLTGADVVLLSHIHRPDVRVVKRAEDGVEVPVILIGSPRRTAFASGELVEKGFVVVEFTGRVPTWTRVPTPATPLVLVEAQGSATAVGDVLQFMEPMPGGSMAGAEIRLRYTTPADKREFFAREAAKWADAMREAGAIEVRVEPVILPTTRARAPEVAAAIGVEAQARAVWGTQGVEPARQDRMATLVRQVEECVR